MNILALDTSTARLEVGLYNGDMTLTHIYDPLSRQSEMLLPAIDSLLKSAAVKVEEIDCFSLAAGPGSFTSLRLGYSALKAFSLINGAPIYAIPTLDLYIDNTAKAITQISALDARSGSYFCKIANNGDTLLETQICNVDTIAKNIPKNSTVGLCGPSAKLLFSALNDYFNASGNDNQKSNRDGERLFMLPAVSSANVLIECAKKLFENGDAGIKDFTGPLYFSASSAELRHNKKSRDLTDGNGNGA